MLKENEEKKTGDEFVIPKPCLSVVAVLRGCVLLWCVKGVSDNQNFHDELFSCVSMTCQEIMTFPVCEKRKERKKCEFLSFCFNCQITRRKKKMDNLWNCCYVSLSFITKKKM